MEKVRIFAPASEQKGILRVLQGLSIMEITATDSPEEGFTREDTNPEEDRKKSLLADGAIKILDRVSPEKKGLLSSFSGRRKVTAEEFFAAADKTDEIMKLCEELREAERRIAETSAEIARLKVAAEQLAPWSELDLPLSFSGTKKTAAFIGSVSGSYTLETFCESLAKENSEVEFYAEIVGETSGQTLVFVTTAKEHRDKTAEALRRLEFTYPAVSCDLPPAERIEELQKEIAELQKEISKTEKEISEKADFRRDMELVSDWFLSRAERLDVRARLDKTRHTVVITGFVPEKDMTVLREALENRFTVYIESEAAEGDEVPVKLQNNAFSAPAESITSMYALPSRGDIDPTPITSFFYYLFFGIMLSDAGYGLLMWIATWAVNRFLDPEPNMRKNMKLFMYCGISTTLWGFFFGSFFGVDIITAIYSGITGAPLPFKYPFINPLAGDALAMLILSLGLGFVQIIAGLITKFVITVKDSGWLDAIFDTGLWITTLSGFAVMAVGLVTLPVLQTVGLAIAFGSMAGIVLTGGRKKKGIMKIFGGVANLYDITGFVSDLLSFSRLMALGLTTAAMSMVFNKLGVMVSAGLAGKIFMIVILLVGHAVNFGLNALGAYVHTLRLQYVELFSKFYEGGGRAFIPFTFKGKYVRIKEEK